MVIEISYLPLILGGSAPCFRFLFKSINRENVNFKKQKTKQQQQTNKKKRKETKNE